MPNRNEAGPSQQFVEIKSIKNETIILKAGALRQIIAVSGINFDLKSEEEQELIINGFQDFLNSLSFSLQIFIHSRKINIDRYLDNLSARLEKETNELLKTQIAEYREFVRAFVTQNAIMTKTYFVVVPFDPVSLPKGASGGITRSLLGIFNKSVAVKQTGETEEDKDLNLQIEQIGQRTLNILAGLNQIGLRAVRLNDEELIELFYNLYNPEAIEKESLEITKTQSERSDEPPKQL